MATNNIKFITTTSDKLSDIEIKTGQIIFSRDTRTIYLDALNERTAYQQIIILDTEEHRKNLVSPINRSFYFVEDTAILWNFLNGQWKPLNEKPEEKIVFEDLPVQGKEGILYIQNGQFYEWDSILKTYTKLGEPEWGQII